MQKLNISLATLAAFTLFAHAVRLEAAVTGLEFANGNGAASVDQFAGIAGGGWAGGWGIGNNEGVGSITGTVTNASPLNGGGNYLSTMIDSTRGVIRRDYNSEGTAPALTVTSPHIVQFNHRLDAVGSDFAAGGRRIVIFDNPSAVSGTGGTNTFILQVANDGQWVALNGNKNGTGGTNTNVGLSHVVGETYTVAIRTRPADQEYDLHISDGVNDALLMNMGYRTGTAAAGTVLHFGHDSNGTSGGFTDANDDTTFSLDALTLSNGAKSWNNAGTGDWFGTSNWASQGSPSIFDSVAVSNGGTVVLDNPTNRRAFAGSLAVTNGTLEVASPLEVAQSFTLDSLGELAFDGADLSTSTALLEVGDLVLNGGSITVTGDVVGGMKLIDFSGTLTGSIDNITFNRSNASFILVLNTLDSSIDVLQVPEPTTSLLLSLGLVCIGRSSRRRKLASQQVEAHTL